MKNNLKYLYFLLIGLTTSTVYSQSDISDYYSQKKEDGVFVARVIMPKNAVTKYNMKSYSSFCWQKMYANFINAETRKPIRFYDMDNLFEDPYKNEMSDVIFIEDSPFYEPKLKKSYRKYVEENKQMNLIENIEINKYTLKPQYKNKVFLIYYRWFNCNGSKYRVFFGIDIEDKQ